MAGMKEKGQEDMRSIEEILERLHDAGLFEIPERSPGAEEPYPFIKPSDAARAAGKRVRQRVLSGLGLADIGAYVARVRKARNMKILEVSRRIRLSSEVLREVETSRLPFFELPLGKAADLVEALKLDPMVVLHFLGSLDLSGLRQRQPSRLFRTDRSLDETQKLELEKESLRSRREIRNKQEELEEFVRKFVAELSRRRILKR
jgi:hypothetical protein